MTDAERTRRRDAELEAYHNGPGGAQASAWLNGLPRRPHVPWTPPAANDDFPIAANDNIQFDEAA